MGSFVGSSAVSGVGNVQHIHVQDAPAWNSPAKWPSDGLRRCSGAQEEGGNTSCVFDDGQISETSLAAAESKVPAASSAGPVDGVCDGGETLEIASQVDSREATAKNEVFTISGEKPVDVIGACGDGKVPDTAPMRIVSCRTAAESDMPAGVYGDGAALEIVSEASDSIAWPAQLVRELRAFTSCSKDVAEAALTSANGNIDAAALAIILGCEPEPSSRSGASTSKVAEEPNAQSATNADASRRIPTHPARDVLIRDIFRTLDVHGSGHLGSAEIRRFAGLTGFEGTDAEWRAEYELLCKEKHRSSDDGFDEAAFCALVNDASDEGSYCNDEELQAIWATFASSGGTSATPGIVLSGPTEAMATIATPQGRSASISLPQKRRKPENVDGDVSCKVFLTSTSSSPEGGSRPAQASVGQRVDQRRFFASGIQLKKASAPVTLSLSDDEC